MGKCMHVCSNWSMFVVWQGSGEQKSVTSASNIATTKIWTLEIKRFPSRKKRIYIISFHTQQIFGACNFLFIHPIPIKLFFTQNDLLNVSLVHSIPTNLNFLKTYLLIFQQDTRLLRAKNCSSDVTVIGSNMFNSAVYNLFSQCFVGLGGKQTFSK